MFALKSPNGACLDGQRLFYLDAEFQLAVADVTDGSGPALGFRPAAVGVAADGAVLSPASVLHAAAPSRQQGNDQRATPTQDRPTFRPKRFG